VVRNAAPQAILFYASTKKVYGSLEDVAIVEDETRYRYKDQPNGIAENRGIDFHSPYGCSKGSGDQYMHDYARIYNLKTVVMRQSCIYGIRHGTADHHLWQRQAGTGCIVD
jgi:CDP-paratose 2-epimerase